MNTNIKNMVIPTALMVITLVVLALGAAYAYFTVSTSNGVSTMKVTTTVESVGIASLAHGSNLQLHLTNDDMMKKNDNIIYCATIDGVPSTEKNEVAIATASINGNGTMNCTYELLASITGEKNMYDAFQRMGKNKTSNQLILSVDGKDYDFNDTSFPSIITGTLEGLKEENTKNIMASFRVVNRSDINQSELAATDLTISFSVNKFECNIVG